jgi:exosortase D (VPLPA-CTERM-specific)
MTELLKHKQNKYDGRLCAILGFLCLVLIIFAHHRMSGDLFIAWQSGEYSHGAIIPFIAILIGWHRLNNSKPEIKPSWCGTIFLLISGMLLTVATLASFQTAAQYGFVAALVGLTLTFVGIRATKILAPAFVYLLFAIPLPHLIYANLSGELQLISSTIGVFIIDAFGISVFQEGNIIDLGTYKLQVVEACSGLRYLFPLVSFGYLVAYLLNDKMWKRVVIFLSAIPIAIGMNSLRIALIGIAVNFWGIEAAEGFLHYFEGWVIFMLCTILLMLELFILMRIGNAGRFRSEIFTIPRGKIFSGNLRLTAPIYLSAILCLILAIIFGSGMIDKRSEIIPEHKNFSLFPTTIAKWHGKIGALSDDVLQGLQLTDYFLANYTKENDRNSVNLYIAYYASQRIGAANHSPANCIPGGGWQIADKSLKTITMADGKQITVSRLLIRKGNITQLVYYWFDERGRNITETYYAKWYLMVDSLTMQRSDGALIRLVTQLNNKENEDVADKRLSDFLSDGYSVIKGFIPDKTITTPRENED